MSLPDHSIDPKILASAKEEFLSKGYVEASLRKICKTAGVTTGALYKRFAGKEALFEALLAPTLQDLKTIHSEGEVSIMKNLTRMRCTRFGICLR